jgi:hypothetical protein
MSALGRLSARDVELVRESLAAAVRGPFFPEWEFHTLIGLERAEVQRVLESWPDSQEPDDQDLAVSNVLVNLLAYPHDEWEAWRSFSSAGPGELEGVLGRWRDDDAPTHNARGYFEGLR